MSGSIYVPQTWVDGSIGGTPIDAARLNYIEAGIQAAASGDVDGGTPTAVGSGNVDGGTP